MNRILRYEVPTWRRRLAGELARHSYQRVVWLIVEPSLPSGLGERRGEEAGGAAGVLVRYLNEQNFADI
jgi:hypothetical protein